MKTKQASNLINAIHVVSKNNKVYVKDDMTADCDIFLTISNTIYIDAKADCMLSYKGNPTITYQYLKADSKIKKAD